MKLTKAFTLIELIIVITILAILSTIGFIYYANYLISTRDTNRMYTISEMSKSLDLYSINANLPIPDKNITIDVNGKTYSYQGFLGNQILNNIGFNNGGIDPKTKEYFSYSLSKDKKTYELITFLEEPHTENSTITNTDTFPYVIGKNTGLLLNISNIPINKIETYQNIGKVDLLTTNANDLFNMYVNNTKNYTFSGSIIANKFITLTNPTKYSAPKGCPDGFISVWGDYAFKQKGFCVAKYEMTYDDADVPNSVGGGSDTDFNSVHYIPGKEIKSIGGKYPIGDITLTQAISACKSMGKGFHLITNSEWMTISRQIELESINWSSGEIGTGIIYNGVSSDTTLGCDGTGGNSEPRIKGTKTGKGIDKECNKRRIKTLYNGEKIWDIAGNMREAIDGQDKVYGFQYNTVKGNICNDDNRHSWYGDDGTSECDFQSPYTKYRYGPLLNINALNGIGRIQSYKSELYRGLYRGGSARDLDFIGIYTFGLTRDENSVGTGDLGFRCAF